MKVLFQVMAVVAAISCAGLAGAQSFAKTSIEVGEDPRRVALNEATNTVYVTNADDGTVSVINGADNTVSKTIDLGQGQDSFVFGIAVNEATNTVYVAYWSKEVVSVIDGNTNTVTKTIDLESEARGVAVNEATNRVYVAGFYSDAITVIDGTDNTIAETISLPDPSPWGVGVNETANMIYVTHPSTNTVSVIDGESNNVSGSITVGEYPRYTGINESTNTIYVSNSQDQSISVIDGARGTVFKTINFEDNPSAVAVNQSSDIIYVGFYWDMAVIDGADNTVIDFVGAGNNTSGIAVNETTRTVYVGIQYEAYVAAISRSGDFAKTIFFPHIACSQKWETEICLINTNAQELEATLKAYNDQGEKVSEEALVVSANGRRAFTIGEEFSNGGNIKYMRASSDSAGICGYTKFYQDGVFRVAVPAVQEVNTGDIYIPHVASNNTWWTGLALVNTMDTTKYVTITFNTGDSVGFSLRPGEHKQFSIKELFDDASQEEIAWGVLSDADGVIGLELFGAEKRLSGVLLRNECSETLYFPHVASNQTWWTGIAACKPGSAAAELTVKPYRKDGTALAELGAEIGAEGKYYGDAGDLGLPAETAWFAIEASRPLNGFELFGTTNADQLAGYSAVNIKRQQGVFPKLEAEGWTGIAFVNTAAGSAEVSLRLYQDDGTVAAEKTLPLAGHAKKVETGEALFSGAAAEGSYIAFSADTDVVGFQLNSSADNKMLDALPGM